MVQIGAYQQTAGYYNNTVDRKQQTNRSGVTERAQASGYVDKSKEQTLSRQAQDVLKRLREKYGDMDFMMANLNDVDEVKSTIAKGTKEFSVLISRDELEKMASDEKYFEEKTRGIEGAVRMSAEINQKFGFERALGKDGTADVEISRIGILLNDDGTTSFFAQLEKSSAKQTERIQEAREEKRGEKKAEERKVEKELQSYARSGAGAKRTVVWADSIEELLEKIGAVDWDKVKSGQMPGNGGRFDYSI